MRILITGNMGYLEPILCLSANTGYDESNYQVRDPAETGPRKVSGTPFSIKTSAQSNVPVRSTFCSTFRFESLAADQIPQVLDESTRRLRDGVNAVGFAGKDLRNCQYMRLKTLERHLPACRLGPDLRLTVTRAQSARLEEAAR
jgi:hypothetical protein